MDLYVHPLCCGTLQTWRWCGTMMIMMIQTMIGFIILLLRNQGLEHMPRMHRSLKAYCATLLTPLMFLDVPTFAARCLHVHTTREIQAAKGGTCG